MRDRLIELIGSKVCEAYSPTCDEWQPHSCEKCFANSCRIGDLADHLLANGVIVPPVKIGQTVYVVSRYYGGFWRTHECKIDSLTIYDKHIFMTLFDRDNFDFGIEISEIGKIVFLTKEQAEKALAERSGK